MSGDRLETVTIRGAREILSRPLHRIFYCEPRYLELVSRQCVTSGGCFARFNFPNPDFRPAIGARTIFGSGWDAGIILFPIRVHAPTQTCGFHSCKPRAKLPQ